MPSKLTDLIRKKYPGQYDDMDDATLEKSVLAKHPEYKDLAVPMDEASPAPMASTVAPPDNTTNQPFTGSPRYQPGETRDAPKEPDTLWGGRWKGLNDYVSEFGGSMLESMAHPKTTGDFLNLVVPGEFSHLPKGAFSRLAESIIGTPEGRQASRQIRDDAFRRIDDVVASTKQRASGIESVADSIRRPTDSRVWMGDEAPPTIKTNPNAITLPEQITTAERPAGPWSENPDLTAKPAVTSEAAIYQNAREKFNMGKDNPDLAALEGKEKLNPFAKKVAEQSKPTAEFLGMQPDGLGGEIHLFNVKGGPKTGSTVTLDTLAELGIEAPEVPKAVSNQPRMTGDQMRAAAIKKRSAEMDARNPGFKGTVAEDDEAIRQMAEDRVPSDNTNPEVTDEVRRQMSEDMINRENKRNILADERDQIGKDINANAPVTPEKPMVRYDQETGAIIPIDRTTRQQIGPARFGNKELDPNFASSSKYNSTAQEAKDRVGRLQSYWDFARGTMSVDPPFVTSAAFRQASPYAGTKPWFQAWAKGAKAYGSKTVAQDIESAALSQPLFKPTKNFLTGKMDGPSYADQVGLLTGDLSKYMKRDEAIRGQLAERIPIYGRHVAASNRAFNAFLNSVSRDTLTNLVNDAVKLSESGKSGGLTGNMFTNKPTPNPLKDLTAGKAIAEMINTSLKRGKLGVEVGNYEVNLEKQARFLSNTFFSPRSISSEIRVLNPSTYIMTNPFVRKQYVTNMVRRVGMWWTLAGLASLGGAKVSRDITSPDFGKIRIGDTRIDPPGGLQQFLVLGAQTAAGGKTSTTTKDRRGNYEFTPFGQGYKPETRFSNALQFGINRLHPTLKFGVDAANATERAPFHVGDRTIQMFAPMFTNDLADIVRQNPELSPLAVGLGALVLGASGAGMGTQSYEKGSYGKPSFIPEELDWNIGAKPKRR